MLFTLIISVAAGAATRPLQPQITELLARVLRAEQMPDSGGRKVLGFALMLMAASVVLAVLDADAAPLLLVLGGVLGYFQEEIRAAITDRQS